MDMPLKVFLTAQMCFIVISAQQNVRNIVEQILPNHLYNDITRYMPRAMNFAHDEMMSMINTESAISQNIRRREDFVDYVSRPSSSARLESSAKNLVGTVVPPRLMNAVQNYIPTAMSIAHNVMNDMLRGESRRAHSMRSAAGRSRSGKGFTLVARFLGGSPHTKQMSFPAFMQSKMIESIKIRFSLNNAQTLAVMATIPPVLQPNTAPHYPDTPLPTPQPGMCPFPQNIICQQNAIYRTIDGCCNNLKYPIRGSAMQPLARFLPPVYADAISAPRVSVTGSELPSVRLISSTVHWDIDLAHHIHTLMLMQFGQFIDHDLSRTAISKLSMHPSGFGEELEDVECGFDGCQTQGVENQACLPIPVPRNDTVFGHKPCLMFVRSQEVPFSPNCRLGPREQLNQITSWIDASLVYGSTKKEADKLRDFSDPARGRLVMTTHPAGRHREILPKDPEFKDCNNPTAAIKCFAAGDGRVNEVLGLTAMHTLFAREHNRIEAILFQINPHWGGERLYQESRHILTAKWQFLIFNEWLPLVLGKATMDQLGLTVQSQGYWNSYNQETDPNVGNTFATAAFRFGHSLVQGLMQMKGKTYGTKGTIPLSTMFRTPHMLYVNPEDGVDSLVRGIIGMHAQTRDPFIVKELTTQLFAEDPPKGLGEDLMSLNMQRGREHGIPGYNSWREWCGLPKAQTFDDLSNELPIQVIERFKRLYSHVDDIDLWPAGISEFALPGAVLGPTYACIIGRQFKNLKFGDRFWFENNVQNPHPFSQAQLQEIRKTSLAKVICDNSDTIDNIQPRVLLQPLPEVFKYLKDNNRLTDMGNFNEFYFGTENLRVPCRNLPEPNLQAWRDVQAPPVPQFQPPPQFNQFQHPNSVNGFLGK